MGQLCLVQQVHGATIVWCMGQQQQQGATSIVLQAHWDNNMVLGAASTQSNNGAASTWVTTWCSSGTRYNSAKHWDNNVA